LSTRTQKQKQKTDDGRGKRDDLNSTFEEHVSLVEGSPRLGGGYKGTALRPLLEYRWLCIALPRFSGKYRRGVVGGRSRKTELQGDLLVAGRIDMSGLEEEDSMEHRQTARAQEDIIYLANHMPNQTTSTDRMFECASSSCAGPRTGNYVDEM
jgi:hypothetical protein